MTADVDEVQVETNVPDIRDIATPDPTEKMHPAARRRVPAVDPTTQGVAEAQAALVEIAQRQQADAERTAREAEENTRRTDLTRWQESDADGDSDTSSAESQVVDEPAMER